MSRLPVVGPKPAPGDKRRRVLLDELYAELPKLECAGLCSEACGPIGMSRVEWQRICRRLKEDRKATGLECPMLDGTKCSVYDIRPMICRLWGIVQTMPCPWGCVPERWLTQEEGFVLLERAREIGG